MEHRARIAGIAVGAALIAAGAIAGGPISTKNTGAAVASIAPDEKWTATGALAKSRKSSLEAAALDFTCTAQLLEGAYGAVEQTCARAIALRPSDPVPHKLLGISLLIQKRYGSSAYQFKEAVRLAPADPGSQVGLGEALRGLDDYQGSIDAFTAAIQLSPQDGGIWNARCWTRGLFARELRLGLGDCEAALRLMPGNPAILDSSGLIHFRLGELHLALRDYTAAVTASDKIPTAFYGRGATLLRLGAIKDGVRDISRARALDPSIDAEFLRAPLIAPACNTALHSGAARIACIKPARRAPDRQTPQSSPSGRSAANEASGQKPAKTPRSARE